jgi:hypothetical protein
MIFCAERGLVVDLEYLRDRKLNTLRLSGLCYICVRLAGATWNTVRKCWKAQWDSIGETGEAPYMDYGAMCADHLL